MANCESHLSRARFCDGDGDVILAIVSAFVLSRVPKLWQRPVIVLANDVNVDPGVFDTNGVLVDTFVHLAVHDLDMFAHLHVVRGVVSRLPPPSPPLQRNQLNRRRQHRNDQMPEKPLTPEQHGGEERIRRRRSGSNQDRETNSCSEHSDRPSYNDQNIVLFPNVVKSQKHNENEAGQIYPSEGFWSRILA